MADSSPFTVMTNFLSLNSANSVKHLGKTPLIPVDLVQPVTLSLKH